MRPIQSASGERCYSPTLTCHHPGELAQAVATARSCHAAASRFSMEDAWMSADLVLDVRLPDPVVTHLVDGRRLFGIAAGVRISDAQRALASYGRALPSVPGYTGVTFIGAAQTSSHGCGLGAGPLGELVRAYELVDGMGRLRAVQSPDDPVLQALPQEGEVLSDRRLFRALGVGLGALGAITRVWIEPPREFWFHDSRRLSTWAEASKRMASGAPFEALSEAYLLNPYPRADGQRSCSIDVHGPLAGLPGGPRRRSETLPSLLRQAAAMAALRPVFARAPRAIPGLIERSFAVFAPDREIEGPAGSMLGHDFYGVPPRGYGLEFSVPYGPGDSCQRAVAFVDALLGAVDGLRRSDRYVGGFVSIRFSRRWDAPLSLTHGADACHIELIALGGTWRGRETLTRLETLMRCFEPRLHFGLLNNLTKQDVDRLYPEVDVFREASATLDPRQRFANGLSDRLGLTGAVEAPIARNAARAYPKQDHASNACAAARQ